DDQALAVQVALELEQVRLDATLAAPVVRVDPDRDRRPVTARRARVDPVRGHQQLRLQRQVRGREPKRPAALVPENDCAVELSRPAEEPRGRGHLALSQQRADPGGRDAVEQPDRTDLEPELLERGSIAGSSTPKAEV